MAGLSVCKLNTDFIMALQIKDQSSWEQFFSEAKIPKRDSTAYAKIFVNNRITGELLSDITKETLQELGINVLGDCLAILKHARNSISKPAAIQPASIKAPAAKLPQINQDMTLQQYRKFLIDWNVFKQITGITDTQITVQLYSCCDDAVQNSIVNTVPDIFSVSEKDLLKSIEETVTKRSNPTVHRMNFAAITQNQHETVQDYLIRLKSSAPDCEFSCPGCNFDLQPNHIRDQFIRGLHNDTLQTDILAKASHLKNLEDIIKHAEAFETALRDQQTLQGSLEAMAVRSSYKNQQQWKPPQPRRSNLTKACAGCGSQTHGHADRSTQCTAWGTTCHNCNRLHHFARVCRQPKASTSIANRDESAHGLIAHVQQETKPKYQNRVELINMTMSPCLPRHQKSKSIVQQVFPDSGASLCLANFTHISRMNLSPSELIPCSKRVTVVGGSTINCTRWLPIEFTINGHSSKQPVFICDKADRVYLGRQACIDLRILPPCYPYPMPPVEEKEEIHKVDTMLPERPSSLPYPATTKNIDNLKQHLIEKFKNTVFNNAGAFPAMETPLAHIHLKPNATPYANHVPIPVPYHWKEQVRNDLESDVERGIIQPVPIGSPVTWCSKMIVTPKKNGKPRRVVDFQKLNAQCLRETHHCPSPFQAASQIPPGTKKTVFDAVDGYHSIPLDKDSQPLTTFITEWGRYQYLRMPQGYLAAGDAYTRRFDEILSILPRKVKVVDDCLLYDDTIEQSFYHAWDFLEICAKHGITINIAKFQFCQDTVEFAGLNITLMGIIPGDKLISAIRDFPTPTNITDARSWFGLVNQAAWSYSVGPIMEPFRELVKHNSNFHWDANLDQIFSNSKDTLIAKIAEGIRTFDTSRPTCLQPDWCKTGLGYLLLQKYCACSMDNAPICCPDGWKLVFAGSRFTQGAECNYAPTEGEALALSWSINHAKNYVLGCQNLLIVTDHKPLLGIFNDRELNTISNPRTCKLKEKTLRFQFQIQHCPGKWHRGPDACSRNPPPFTATNSNPPTTSDINSISSIEDHVFAVARNAVDMINHNMDTSALKNSQSITLAQIRMAAEVDQDYLDLTTILKSGFPEKKSKVNPNLREFWEVRDRLLSSDDIVLMNNRIVIPKALRNQTLQSLHAAHQGTTAMSARANQTVYWPGMNAAIRNHRANCAICNQIAPSQSAEPLILTPEPEWPFQKICADYFEHDGHSYLTTVDRFSFWVNIYHLPHTTATKSLLTNLRTLFTSYGVLEEIASDGGPQFISTDFQSFLKTWGIHHRLSSAEYPQSNGRAELAVKTAKRIILENTVRGSLDTDKVARALLQYRNTPIQSIGLSPAQVLFHRQMRDHLPNHPTHLRLHKKWLISAKRREQLASIKKEKMMQNKETPARNLPTLPTSTKVAIQDRRGKNNFTNGTVPVLLLKFCHIANTRSGWMALDVSAFATDDS